MLASSLDTPERSNSAWEGKERSSTADRRSSDPIMRIRFIVSLLSLDNKKGSDEALLLNMEYQR